MKLKGTGVALLNRIREHVKKGTYILVKHAIARQIERQINLPQVLHVLEHGIHEEQKDHFDIGRQAWKYAVRGKTIEGIEIRVIVAFEEEMVIITVMKIKS